jgi:membrane-bound lytic murein transglycosylase D
MRIVIAILLSFNFLLANAEGHNDPEKIAPNDSASTQIFRLDYPNLRICDSIYTSCYTDNSDLNLWKQSYNFPEDSIPAYLDSTYMERIETMNIHSPFSFQYNADVRKMILFYANRRPKLISKALNKQSLYFPLFEEMLDKYQLPMELKYLAVVESALNPRAKSRAGALGLWQFMPGTGRLYGLHYNSKLDDRMNIYKSTEAACQHFTDLYNIYHDWNLVLAAYNAGPGNVNKAIRRCGTSTDYWEIRHYLPRETQNYVPAFVAINYLMNYSDAHNIKAEDNELSYFDLDTVYVSEPLKLKQIADWLEMDESEIITLNPQYKKKYIPVTAGRKYVLTLPKNRIGEFILNRDIIITGISRKEYESQAER